MDGLMYVQAERQTKLFEPRTKLVRLPHVLSSRAKTTAFIIACNNPPNATSSSTVPPSTSSLNLSSSIPSCLYCILTDLVAVVACLVAPDPTAACNTRFGSLASWEFTLDCCTHSPGTPTLAPPKLSKRVSNNYNTVYKNSIYYYYIIMALTEEQRERIRKNRERALQLQKQRRENQQAEQQQQRQNINNEDSSNNKRKLTSNCLEGEEKNPKRQNNLQKQRQQQQKKQKTIDNLADDDSPIEAFEEGASEWVTKKEAMSAYCLPEGTLAVCECKEQENPHHKSWAPMKLYRRSELRRRAHARFGGLEGLAAERNLRSERKFMKDFGGAKNVFK